MQPDMLKAPGGCRTSVLTSSVMPLEVDFLEFKHFGGFGDFYGWVQADLCSALCRGSRTPLCFQDFPPRFVIDWSWKDENCFV